MADTDTRKPLRIGVLYENTQMTDLVGIDVLGSMSSRIVDMVSNIIPAMAQFKEHAVPMEFLYISSTTEPAWTTPEMFVKPTHTYRTAPRDLDIILLGGPDPTAVHEDSLTFLREASQKTKAILATCTGGMWLARSGLLDGKKATTNRMLLDLAKQLCPKVEWVEQRWVIEKGEVEGAQLWTSGGAGCGIDMTIEYALQNFNDKLVEIACNGLEFETKNRSQFYKEPLPVS